MKKVEQRPIRMYLDNPQGGGVWRIVGYPHNGMVSVELVMITEGEPVQTFKSIGFYASEWAKLRCIIDRVAEDTKQAS